MESTTSAILLREISEGLKPLQNLNNSAWTDPNFLGALLASLVALIIATFGELFTKIWKKTNLAVETDVLTNVQGNNRDLILYRLLISNMGNVPAKNVEVYVSKLFERDQEKENFLPVPLVWTHARAYMTAGVYRNIHPNQSVMLDFCEFTKNRNLLKLRLAAGDEFPDFCILQGGMRAVLKMYQEDGKTIDIQIDINWEEGKEPVIRVNS